MTYNDLCAEIAFCQSAYRKAKDIFPRLSEMQFTITNVPTDVYKRVLFHKEYEGSKMILGDNYSIFIHETPKQ